VITQELLLQRPVEGVALLTINRPKARNALTTTLQFELDAALKRLLGDEDVRAVVVTGAGDRAFSAGYDLKEMHGFDQDWMLLNYLDRQTLMAFVAAYPKPLIGALNGLSHGGGAILASLFDIRVGCSRSEFRFTAAAYNGVNNTWQLPRLIGQAKALEFTLTARPVSAEEALAADLLNHLVGDDEVVDRALEIAAMIAAHPEGGIRWHKALIRANAGRGIDEALQAENAVMSGELRPRKPSTVFREFLATHRPA
jgi:enoyl-CoA hydratase/carnithine racemase